MVTVESIYANKRTDSGSVNVEQFKSDLREKLNDLLKDGYDFDKIKVDTSYYLDQLHAIIIAYKDDA